MVGLAIIKASKSNVIIYFQSIRRAVEKRNEMRILQLTHAKKGLVPQQDQNISVRSDSSFLLCKGSYNEQYCTLEQIGKGAFGCVKTAFRRSDRRMVRQSSGYYALYTLKTEKELLSIPIWADQRW